jgi:DisA bacterial checkpoint controller nucleotide-binding
MTHAYPRRLAEFARARWRELESLDDPGPCDPRGGTLPDVEALEHLLSIAYQASLLQEEDRPVRFRLFVGDPERLPAGVGPPEGLHCLRFKQPRRYDEHEIRRLAPAAKFTRALIGVRIVDRHFEIWGMLQSGPRWLQSARGGRPLASPVPSDAVVIRAVGPGRLAIALGEVILAELRGGQLQSATMDVFESKWLSSRFVRLRTELLTEHAESMRDRASAPLDPDVTRKVAQQMVKRLIATMRDAHHGGTLLLVPRERATTLVSDGGAIRLKYAFVDDEPRRRYRTLILAVMRDLALAGASSDPASWPVDWKAYRSSTRPAIVSLDEAILEMSQLLAALGEVDGAVLLTDSFEVLGFGGEIVGTLPVIRSVRRALDIEGTESEEVPIDSVGTRHRSAYRLCAQEPTAVAIVVSHDGGVQFVANRDGVTTYWEHVPLTGAEV